MKIAAAFVVLTFIAPLCRADDPPAPFTFEMKSPKEPLPISAPDYLKDSPLYKAKDDGIKEQILKDAFLVSKPITLTGDVTIADERVKTTVTLSPSGTSYKLDDILTYKAIKIDRSFYKASESAPNHTIIITIKPTASGTGSVETEETFIKSPLDSTTVTTTLTIKDGKAVSGTRVTAERAQGTRLDEKKESLKFDAEGKLVTGETANKTEPVQSNRVKIYTELSAGIGWSSATRRDFYTVAVLDGAGNPVIRDGKQVYRVTQKDPQTTVSTSLSGLISFVYQCGGTTSPIHAIGATIGAGFNNATSGTFSLAPFAGMSLYFGEQDSVALTIGLSWVPIQRLRGLALGQEILSDQLSTYESYGPPSLFIGLTYRIKSSG